MNPSTLTPTERAALREQAVRRAHELRREAIVEGWNVLLAALRRVVRRGREDLHALRAALKT
jgi:hypothetical protein